MKKVLMIFSCIILFLSSVDSSLAQQTVNEEVEISIAIRAAEYYSCFISYSTKDMKFAGRLKKDLSEKRVPKQVLFPIKIDDYFDEWEDLLKQDIEEINIGDFCGWKDPEKCKPAFDRLLEGLNKG